MLISGKFAKKKKKKNVTIHVAWTTVESGHGVFIGSLLLLLPRTFSFFVGQMGGWLVGYTFGWLVG